MSVNYLRTNSKLYVQQLQPLLSTPQILPEPAQRHVHDLNMTPTPTPALPKSLEVSANTISRPDVSDIIPRIQRPEPAQHTSLVPDPNMTPIPALLKSLEATTSTLSRPDPSDLPRIQRLTRESCDIHRQINALNVRDASIISELKQLNATYIPGSLKADPSKHPLFFIPPLFLSIHHTV